MSLTPYEILQLDEDASISEIKHRYRNLIKYLHPDKKRVLSGVAYIDNMKENERKILFENVQNAYKMLKKLKGKQDMPFDNVDYIIENDFRNINVTGVSTGISGFNSHQLEKFNREFDRFQKEKENDMDPQSMGYASFNHVNKDNSVVQTNFIDFKERKPNLSGERKSEQFSFGLTVIDDYSINFGQKKSLCGMDLGAVYGTKDIKNIHEQGDKELSKKEFEKKIKEKMKERKKIDKQIEDESIYLGEEYEKRKLREQMRMDNERKLIQENRDKINTVRRIKM